MINKVCKFGKVNGRIPVDPGAKKNETEIWIEKDGFKTGVIGSKLEWQIVETVVINC